MVRGLRAEKVPPLHANVRIFTTKSCYRLFVGNGDMIDVPG